MPLWSRTVMASLGAGALFALIRILDDWQEGVRPLRIIVSTIVGCLIFGLIWHWWMIRRMRKTQSRQ
jgi:ABC-type proline/glycine betaine transport system permease subunit